MTQEMKHGGFGIVPERWQYYKNLLWNLFCGAGILFKTSHFHCIFQLFEMFLKFLSIKEHILCNLHGLHLFNHAVEVATSRFRCFDCAVLSCRSCECCRCVRCATLICLCGKAEEDISSPSDVSASLIFLTWFSSLKLSHQPFLWAFSVSLHPISLRNLLFSLPQFPHPSIYMPMILSISNPFSLSPFLLLLLLLHFFLGAISDPSLSSLLPPCDCSHFLTLPRTRHTQPVDDPQKDPR